MICKGTEFRRRRKLQCIEHKGGKCQRCGYDKCQRALEFHHDRRFEKDLSCYARGGLNMMQSWDKLKAELSKCLLVCANCHRELEEEFDASPQYYAGFVDPALVRN
jgi:hypothetical protein